MSAHLPRNQARSSRRQHSRRHQADGSDGGVNADETRPISASCQGQHSKKSEKRHEMSDSTNGEWLW